MIKSNLCKRFLLRVGLLLNKGGIFVNAWGNFVNYLGEK